MARQRAGWAWGARQGRGAERDLQPLVQALPASSGLAAEPHPGGAAPAGVGGAARSAGDDRGDHAAQYITGSMWRAYGKGSAHLLRHRASPTSLERDSEAAGAAGDAVHQRACSRGIAGVPESRRRERVAFEEIAANHGKRSASTSRRMTSPTTRSSSRRASPSSARLWKAQGQIFVDTKFEFGYVDGRFQGQAEADLHGRGWARRTRRRIWDGRGLRATARVVEKSKEELPQDASQAHFPDPDILLNKEPDGGAVRRCARDNELPVEFMDAVSRTYVGLAERITGKPLPISVDPRGEIVAVLRKEFGLVDDEAVVPA